MHHLSEFPRIGRVLRDAPFRHTGFAADAAAGRAVLLLAADRRWLAPARAAPGAAGLVVPPELAGEVPAPLGLMVAEDPEIAFWELHNHLVRSRGMGPEVAHDVHPEAAIHPSATVEPGCRIGPGVSVGPGAAILAGTILEAGVVIGPGAIVGAEGLFTRRRPGRVLKVLHAGGVHVGPEAEIQAGCLVGRAVTPGFTRIGARALVSTGATVSHGVELGEDVTLGGGAVVCGYTRVGARAWIGPNATVADRLEIGADARVEIGATLVRDVPAGGRYAGLFARPHAAMRRMSVALRRIAGGGA